MAKERKASVIYEGNGTQQTFSFPFDYLRKAFIKAEIIGSDIIELEQGKDYSITDKELTLNSGLSVAIGKLLKIYRETTTDPLVEWQDASVLRSADLSLQEVQLLHLAEETADKVFDTGMSTSPTNTNVWDGQYKRITNLLDPQEGGDAVTLRFVNDKQHGLITALKNEGANQNASIVATGNTQNTRLTTTGDTQNKRLTDTGDAQNSRLINTGDTQNDRLITTGDSYVDTMTSLKADTTTQANTAITKATEASVSAASAYSSAYTATTKANEAKNSATSTSGSASTATTKATEASNSAELAKKWAMSDSSPDGVSGNKSSKTWANEAKNSASSASSSASTATTKATEASNSASAAAKSAQDAAKFDPSSYYMKTEVDTKMKSVDNKIADAILQTKEALYPVGAIFISLTDNRNPAEILGFGTWEALPAGYGLVAQGTATAEDGSTLTFIAGQKSGEFKHQLSVGEMPKIEGNFGCSVPNGHHLFAEGVFDAINFGNKEGDVAYAPSGPGTIYGYHIEFGNNQYHNNVAPCISAFCWKRTA